ncbi:MAG TPA: DUF1877 family protein [Ohtaekwangia sp.]|nr:DUF1877 family protein [Ohtaekwangia sp.]
MSFSTTLYRISEDLFRRLESGSIKSNQLVTDAKEIATFQDSPDAIIFLLKKRTGSEACDVEEIFSPKESRGAVNDEEFQKLVASYQYEEIERITASTFYFLPPEKVIAINSFLTTLDDLEVKMLYDADALNANNIYPSLWTSDENPGKAYNLHHIRNDFEALKRIFEHASAEKDYILAFSG